MDTYDATMDSALATGLFALGGVIVGAVTTTGGQVFLDSRRERSKANRAKRLVAGELLQAQLILRSIAETKTWPPFDDVDAYLPTKGWQEYRSRLVDTLDQDLFDHLVMAYAQLEIDRMRFSMFTKRVPPDDQMTIPEALGVWHSFYELGRLRRRLDAGGSGWIDEMENPVRLQVESLLQQIDALSDDVLPRDARLAMLREFATRLSALKEDIPAEWLAESLAEVSRRLQENSPEQ
jgi:hypothetical protein